MPLFFFSLEKLRSLEILCSFSGHTFLIGETSYLSLSYCFWLERALVVSLSLSFICCFYSVVFACLYLTGLICAWYISFLFLWVEEGVQTEKTNRLSPILSLNRKIMKAWCCKIDARTKLASLHQLWIEMFNILHFLRVIFSLCFSSRFAFEVR